MNWLRVSLTCAFALLLSACATVSSNYGSERTDQKGQAYYLPKGLIQITLVEVGGGFDVTVAGPIMIADTDYRLHADLRKPAFSDNDVTISIDPTTQLLDSVNILSTGQAKEIVENFYNATKYAGFQGGYRIEIFSGLYEPDEMDKASRDASAALSRYYRRICGEDGMSPVDPSRFSDCERFAALGVGEPNMVSITTDAKIGASTGESSIAKCGRGLCYRPLVPVKIRTVIADTYVSEDYYMVPDTTTVSYYTLPAGMFATQEYNLTFDQGVLITSEQKQQSEVLGFSRLPTEILKEIISAPVDAILGDRDNDQEPASPEGYGSFTGEGAPGAQLPSYFKSKTISIGSSPAASDPGFQSEYRDPGQSAFPAPQPGTGQGQGERRIIRRTIIEESVDPAQTPQTAPRPGSRPSP